MDIQRRGVVRDMVRVVAVRGEDAVSDREVRNGNPRDDGIERAGVLYCDMLDPDPPASAKGHLDARMGGYFGLVFHGIRTNVCINRQILYHTLVTYRGGDYGIIRR